MALSFAPSLLVLATLIALVLPQLDLCAATFIHEYDVFVSGNDTGTSFTDYLLHAFGHKRIRAYRDDVFLPRVREIEAEKMKAIETSRIAVVVFSKNYATSHCYLDELVKIMECKRRFNQTVIPVFYDVSPSVVRQQTEIFAEPLLNGPMDKVNNWRTALKMTTFLAGLRLKPDREEPKYIKKIVKAVRKKISPYRHLMPWR